MVPLYYVAFSIICFRLPLTQSRHLKLSSPSSAGAAELGGGGGGSPAVPLFFAMAIYEIIYFGPCALEFNDAET